jgi:hypothetical protein
MNKAVMSEADDRLAAARAYAQKAFGHDHARQIVFHCDPKTGKKLTTGQIIAEVEFHRLWGGDFSEHLSEDELGATYLRAGHDAAAELTMIDEAIRYLHDPGLKLPSNRIEVLIQEFAVGVLEDRRRQVTAKRGRKPDVNFLRDHYIATVIKGVCAFGFYPTRNEATKSESGCSIIARVLADGGLDLKEDAVEKIWQNSGETI